jgi:hypothetical protein
MIPTMTSTPEQTEADGTALPPAALAWVDGVGCFQLLPGKQWCVGGPGGNPAADIVICGDISRRAAEISRRGSRYILNRFIAASKPESTGRPLELSTDTTFNLGSTNDVQIKFSRSHPLSASAVLRLISRHRTEPACDAMILVADTCIFGPSDAAHVVCPEAIGPLVFLIGNEGRWYVKGSAPFRVNDERVQGMVPLTLPCRVESGETVIALERLPLRTVF